MNNKELYTMLTKAIGNDILGEDVLQDLLDIRQVIIDDMKEAGEVGKMSKSDDK